MKKNKSNTKHRNETNIPSNTNTMNKCKNIYHRSSIHREVQEMLTNCWFAQSIPKSSKVERNAKRNKFHKVQPHYNFNFILTTYTSTSNVILMWKDRGTLHTHGFY